MKTLFALLAFSLTCYAQKPQDATIIHPAPTCGGWYSQQVDNKCVMTFRFTSIDGLTCVVNTNPSPDAGQSPVEIICTYPVVEPKIDKKAAK